MESARFKPPQEKVGAKLKSAAEDTVKVFCRIKPLQDVECCVKVRSDTTVSLLPPETRAGCRQQNDKEFRHSFSYVFDDKSTQKEIFDRVALPLVEKFIHGKNGLIFAYGVTGSGKTYTMTGKPQDGGIVPRCLDVIFNSISSYQATKRVFIPDRVNGFDVQIEADASVDGKCELHSDKSMRTQMNDIDFSKRIPDGRKIENIKENYTYAVFVTYVEIYNNAVYDLLEDVPKGALRVHQMQVKNVREDANHNMYVHSVTEVEVKSTEEAFEVFCKGQKKKRMATTKLNFESSQSHSVFTIRLVQAPLYSQGEPHLQNESVCISQLSLVNLAGSERTNRTITSGQRLREAGSINNSLMTLRTCLNVLRNIQLHKAKRVVPYRDSKMTLLLRRFFEGESQVHMVVCVNPSVENYAETVHVLRFSEMTQEVQTDFISLPVRKTCNLITKEGLKKMEENCNGEFDQSTSVFSLKEFVEEVQSLFRNVTYICETVSLIEEAGRILTTGVDQGRNECTLQGNRCVNYDLGLQN
jgi:kinesin family protein 23